MKKARLEMYDVPTRRACLGGFGAALAGGILPASAADFCREQPPRDIPSSRPEIPLGDINRRVPWGVAMAAPALYDGALVAALEREAPRFLAIANGLKFGDLYPTADAVRSPSRANWTECNDIVSVAARLGVPVRGDCLIWNDWLPPWVTDLARDRPGGWRDDLQEGFAAQFRNVFMHFDELRPKGGRMKWCGVVNEPFNPWIKQDGRSGWREGAWVDAYGTDADGTPRYIGEAFRQAERYGGDTATQLYLNETNCDNDRFGPIVRPSMLRLVDSLQRAGRKIDAVGLECHLMPQWMSDPDKPNWRPLVGFLQQLAKRGLKIYLTELDVNDCSERSALTRDQLVATYMSTLIQATLEVPEVAMITNWDFSDRYSWWRGDGSPSAVYPSMSKWASCIADPPCPRPTIYDQALRAKPARNSLAKALAP